MEIGSVQMSFIHLRWQSDWCPYRRKRLAEVRGEEGHAMNAETGKTGKPAEARRGEGGCPPRALRGSTALLTPCFQTSHLQNFASEVLLSKHPVCGTQLGGPGREHTCPARHDSVRAPAAHRRVSKGERRPGGLAGPPRSAQG